MAGRPTELAAVIELGLVARSGAVVVPGGINSAQLPLWGVVLAEGYRVYKELLGGPRRVAVPAEAIACPRVEAVCPEVPECPACI